jgi:hypothetical protein
MTPGEFVGAIVEPNIQEFLATQTDIRRAINAIHAVDDLVGQIHAWAKANAPGSVADDDDEYRDHLSADEEFRALRDMAAALKHGELDRPKKKMPRLVIRSTDLKARQRAFDISASQANAFQTANKAAWVDWMDVSFR